MEIFQSLSPEIRTFIMAMMPVIELRGAIPYGVSQGLSHMSAFLISVIGSTAPVPLIILLFRPITDILIMNKYFKKFVQYVVDKTLKEQSKIKKFGLFGLFAIVAVPLPGTGAWTGSFLSSLLKIRIAYAVPIIALGNAAAGLLVLALTYGIGQIF